MELAILIAVCVLGIAGFIAVLIQAGSIAEIHLLVNSRFSKALDKIDELTDEVKTLKALVASLQAEVERLGGAKAPERE